MKKKRYDRLKRALAFIIVAALCLAVFSGCGGKRIEDAILIKPSDGEFVPEKNMALTVWTTQGSDFVPPVMAREPLVENWLIEKTKVKIENMYGNGGGQWESLLSRLIAGNNFPDLVVCGGGQGPAHFAKIAEIDKIWELTPEVLQAYAPDIWAKVPQSVWERIKVNGKIYGIPFAFPVSREIDPDVDSRMMETAPRATLTNLGTSLWVRDDILKMLYPKARSYNEIMAIMQDTGKPVGDYLADVPINSTEDYIKFLRDIKALNLKVGDKSVYSFGYAGADCWVPLAGLGPEMIGYKGHNYTSSWNPVTEEIRLPILEEPVKRAALLQNRLVREEVIDPESLVHTDAQCKEKVLNGQYATVVMTAIGHPPAINSALEKEGKPFRYRPVYTNVPAIEGYPLCKSLDSWGGAVGIFKTVSPEDVPQVLNWMNKQFTDEFEEVFYWGPKEARLYEDKADGGRFFKDDRFNNTYIHMQSNQIAQGENYGLQSSGFFVMRFMNTSKWHPGFYNGVQKYMLTLQSGAKVSEDGPYKAEVILSPPSEAWSAEYANLEIVQAYWSTRSQWEDPFKLSLVAKSDEEFEQKWEAAVKNLKSVVDVDDMTKKMTEIARTKIVK